MRYRIQRKYKSFTLVEILIASLIFVSVMVVATASFALVKKSNENTDDLRAASSCARQIEDFIKAQVKSSSFGPRVMAVDLDPSDGKYKIFPITQKMNTNLAGIVLFPTSDEYVILLKQVTASDASYYFEQKTGILDMNKVHPISSLGNRIHSDSCRGMTGAAVANSDRPFRVSVRPRYPASTPVASSSLAAGQLNSLVFEVQLDDLLFRYMSGNVDDEASKARDSQKIIRLNLEVGNSVNSI